ncbi:hypothetical protein AB1N83_011418 [Pleurotus pulmonarius]
MSFSEWSRTCTQMLEDITEGARKTSGWTDDAEAMTAVLSVIKTMKAALNELDGLVSIDDDIFMSQPIVPNPPLDNGLDSFKSEIKDLFRTLEANLSTRLSNVERRLGSGSNSSPISTTTPGGPAPRQQPATSQTYASVAKLAPPTQPKVPQQSKTTTAPSVSKPNTKFVVRFQGHPPSEADRKSSQLLFHSLNLAFSNNAAARNDGLEILGAEWNRSDHNLNDVIISHDTKWSKAVCSRVPSMGFDGHYWDSKALGVLLRRNPIIKNLKITQEPRFVSNPAEGLPPVAPVVFAFEDPDGSKLKELLKTPIFMDGRHTPAIPPNCATSQASALILKDGSSTCECTPRCANCEGDHWATEPNCPEKRKYVPRPLPQTAQTRQPQHQMPIVQLNVARSSMRTHIMLNHLVTNVHIVLLQEPWFGRIGLDKADTTPEGRPINGLPASPAWESFAPLAPGHPKVATYVRRNVLGLTATPRPDIAKHPNILPVEFTYGNFSFLTVNVYNEGNGAKAEAITMLSLLPLNPLIPTVVAGDFNLHHGMWSLTSVANQLGARTRVGISGQRDSVIDLAFFNRAAINSATFSPPVVDEDLSFGSDHNALVYAANLPALEEEEGISGDLGKRLDPGKQEEWTAEFSACCQVVADSFAEPTSDQELDHIVQRLMDCFTQATNICMPDRKPASAKAARWWNEECRNAVEEMRRASREEKPKLLNRMHRIAKKAKQAWANSILESTTPNNVWRIADWSAGKPKPSKLLSSRQTLHKSWCSSPTTPHPEKLEHSCPLRWTSVWPAPHPHL